jgi:AcrR family transcriptional regulator
MPATRSDLHRDIKRGEVLDAAEALFLSEGYEDTTMAAIARVAQVANNSVYWYFPSKDDLLAAVLERRQERALAEVPGSTAGLEERMLALLAELDQVANLTAAVHERASHSVAVADMHDAFHAVAEHRLGTGFRDAGLTPQDAKRAAGAIMAMVEGIHLHERTRDPIARNRLLLWTLRRLVVSSADAAPAP